MLAAVLSCWRQAFGPRVTWRVSTLPHSSTLLASEEEAVPRPETVPVPRAFVSQCAEVEGRRTLDSILHAEEEVAKLRAALEALTESAQQLLSGERGASDART